MKHDGNKLIQCMYEHSTGTINIMKQCKCFHTFYNVPLEVNQREIMYVSVYEHRHHTKPIKDETALLNTFRMVVHTFCFG